MLWIDGDTENPPAACSIAVVIVGISLERRSALSEFRKGDYLLSGLQYLNAVSHPRGNSLGQETPQNNNTSQSLSRVAKSDGFIQIAFPAVNSLTMNPSQIQAECFQRRRLLFVDPFSIPLYPPGSFPRSPSSSCLSISV